ncbi:MAG: methyltransferase domain-containing protein [Vicingaceae bacterium]
MKKYSFRDIGHCEMCKDPTKNHKILGQRLNKSQGLKPKKLFGISVSVVKCNNCGLIYSNPQPIPFDIQNHYGTPPEDYWKESYFNWDSTYFQNQLKQVKRLIDFKSDMKALDIGAGLGKCMLSLENFGFDTYGLEPSIPFYERAISKMGIDKNKLKLGSIEELEYEDNSFDFITFGAVFEHLYEPAFCLEKALKWLKPNGIIHIEVPSSDWLIAKLMNLYYRISGTNFVTNLSPMHSPFHLHEFTLKSFEKLAVELGFRIEKFEYHVASIYYVPKMFHGLLKLYMEKTNTGLQLSIYLRKIE